MLKGLILAVAIAVSAQMLSDIPWVHSLAISNLVLAMLMGVMVANMAPSILTGTNSGLRFAQYWVLRTGVVLFGFNLTLQQVAQLGWNVVLLDTLVVFFTLLIGYIVGTRVLKLSPELSLLTSAGSAICGAAAILATESVIKAKQENTAMAVATVVVFGTLAMMIYPYFFSFSGLAESQYGIYIGSTVHEVAQVIASADAVGAEAVDSALVVKLVRVALLIPFLLIVIRLFSFSEAGQQLGDKVKFIHIMPWFVLVFAACVLLNSIVSIDPQALVVLTTSGQWCLTVAMTALGLNTRFSSLRALGLGPLVLAAMLFVLLVVGGFLLNLWLI